MYRIVEAIKEVGPRNISEIARIARLPIETVRYKIKKQLKDKGIFIHLNVNYGRLGLKRYWLNLYFTKEFEGKINSFFKAFIEGGYLTYYARTLPTGGFIGLLSLPPKFRKEYTELLDRLVEYNVLADFDVWELAWMRHVSMRQEYYDFESSKWIINWKEVAEESVKIEEMRVEVKPAKIDKLDLKILAYLQSNAFLPLTKIARMLGENSKKIRYHYLNHVVRNGLIDRYVIGWTGVGRKNAVLMALQFDDLSRRELLTVENIMHRVPFLFFDTISDRKDLYVAYLIIPLEQYINTLRFISQHKPESLENLNAMIVDSSATGSFSIPYNALNKEKRVWEFNQASILREISQIVH